MTALQKTLQTIAADFAQEILQALRGASIDSLVGVTGARSVGRLAGPSKGAAPKKGGGRLGRRSAGDIAHTLQRIASVLNANPSGLRAEQLRQVLMLDKREMPRPIAEGLSSGVLVKSGQKRATVYTLGSSSQTTKARAGAKKKAASKK